MPQKSKNKDIIRTIFFVVLIGIMMTILLLNNDDSPPKEFSELNFYKTKSFPHNVDFYTYDVNDEGLVLLSLESGLTKKHIAVLSPEGETVAAFYFDEDGGVGVSWQQDNIGVYVVREKTLYTVDMAGNLVSQETVTDVQSAQEKYCNPYGAYARKTRVKAGITYIADDGKNYPEGSSSSLGCRKLVRVDKDGNETVLYESTDDSFRLPPLVMPTVFFVIFLVVNIIAYKRKKRARMYQNNFPPSPSGDGESPDKLT